MKIFKQLLITITLALFVVTPIVALATPQSTFAAPAPEDTTGTTTAAAPAKDCEYRILGIPTWFRGLTDAECNIVSPDKAPGGLSGFIWAIALNIVEIGLFLAGYVALFFVLYGGFQFMTGGSNPGQIEKARKTILNAVIGLAISMASIGIVNLIFRIING